MKRIILHFIRFSIPILLITTTSVSCSGSNHYYDDEIYNSGRSENYHHSVTGDRKKLSFTSMYKGESVYWKVYLEDGEIFKLIKNGERVPDDDISKYEDYITDHIEDMDEDDLYISNNRIHIDSDDFDFDLDIDFDSEQFAKSMEKLGEALGELDIDIDLDFDDNDWDWDDDDCKWDSREFKKNMSELKHNLKKLGRMNIKIDMDMEGFAAGMSEFAESMEDLEIDLSGLEEEMDELKEELEKLKSFLDEVNEELVDDGYIEYEDEDYDLELSRYSMYVNGEKLPEKLHDKYLDIYVDHFGHKPNNTFKMRK